jgi:hypothetical protein
MHRSKRGFYPAHWSDRAAVTCITDRSPVAIYKGVDGTRDALISRGQCIDP